jgi:hypothetical protein
MLLFQVQTRTACRTLHGSAVEEICVILEHGDPIGTPPAVSLWTTLSALLLHSIISLILDWPDLACTDFVNRHSCINFGRSLFVPPLFLCRNEHVCCTTGFMHLVQIQWKYKVGICWPFVVQYFYLLLQTVTSHTQIMSRIRVQGVEDNGY